MRKIRFLMRVKLPETLSLMNMKNIYITSVLSNMNGKNIEELLDSLRYRILKKVPQTRLRQQNPTARIGSKQMLVSLIAKHLPSVTRALQKHLRSRWSTAQIRHLIHTIFQIHKQYHLLYQPTIYLFYLLPSRKLSKMKLLNITQQ